MKGQQNIFKGNQIKINENIKVMNWLKMMKIHENQRNI